MISVKEITKEIEAELLVLESRFWSYVQVQENGCWLWVGGKSHGYGSFRVGSTQISTHRISYFLANKRWPTNLCRHSCDTPNCVRGDHLIDGTPLQNMQDKIERKRHWTKLSEEQAKSVPLLYRTKTQKEIADSMGVSGTTIHRILHGEKWSRVTGITPRR